MYVTDLVLQDFRSYSSLVTQFPPGATVFWGKNGVGKTNILEALHYLATGNSHRVNTDLSLIRTQKSEIIETDGFSQNLAEITAKNQPQLDSAPVSAVIQARVTSDYSQTLLEIQINQGRANKARIDKSPTRMAGLLGHLRLVMFSPEDLWLVRGEPGLRRNWIDQLLCQVFPLFNSTLSDLEKVLKQRAALLKNALKTGRPPDPQTLAVWNETLIPLVVAVSRSRLKLIQDLAPGLQNFYHKVSDTKDCAQLSYVDSVAKVLDLPLLSLPEIIQGEKYPELVFQAIQNSASQEARRGVNLVGPHRDDVVFTLNGHPVKGFASHGETWSFILSLRLATFDYLQVSFSQTPVLLLDDVFAELDSFRRQALSEVMKQAEQVFITAAQGSFLPTDLVAEYRHVLPDALGEPGSKPEGL